MILTISWGTLYSSYTPSSFKCDSSYFREVIYIKKVSKLLTGSAEDTTVPFPIYKCDECCHINKGFNPFEEAEETKLTLND